MKRIFLAIAIAGVLAAFALPALASSSTATVTPSTLAPGGSATVNFSLTLTTAQTVTVDVDIDTSSGQWVTNHTWSSQTFSAGQTRSYSTVWSVPLNQSTGNYYLVVKAFNSAGSQVYAAGNLAPFSIAVAPTTSTTQPTSTPTKAPTSTSTPTPISSATPSPTATIPAGAITVSVDRTKQVGVSKMALGVTLTQDTLKSWGNAAALSSGESLMKATTVYENVHIMGWGTLNPEPSPGQYDWSTLDARIQLIRSTGGVPVITLCCSPDWMKGGAYGTTDWSLLEVAPLPSHYADFASLAKMVAQRYPDVTHFQVWNEMKGFWNSSLNRWDFEGYTNLYNQVYDALKSVNPSIQVGGPYVIMLNDPAKQGSSVFGNPKLTGPYGSIDPRSLDVITYWLANKHGGDFIAFDGEAGGTPQMTASVAQAFANNQFFSDVDTWVRSKTSLPIWWSEVYDTPWGGTEYSDTAQSAIIADTLVKMITSGTSVPLQWGPEGTAGTDNQSMWTNTLVAGGGQPYPYYAVAKAFHDNFGQGTALYQTTTSSSSVDALASATKLLVVNKTAAGVTLSVNGTLVNLPAYGSQVI